MRAPSVAKLSVNSCKSGLYASPRLSNVARWRHTKRRHSISLRQELITVKEIFHATVENITIYHRMELLGNNGF